MWKRSFVSFRLKGGRGLRGVYVQCCRLVEISADTRLNHVKGIKSGLILSRILWSFIGESQCDRVSRVSDTGYKQTLS